MKTILISDSAALGIMEVRPEPAWRVRLTGLRNKDLLAPDYGAMHVAAFLKASGRRIHVANLIADVHDSAALFTEPNTKPDELSGSGIAKHESAHASRRYLFDTLADIDPDVILVTLSTYNLALYTRSLLGEIKTACPGATLVTGGIYSTMHPEEILADGHADVVIRGEGELTASELLDRLAGGRDLDGLKGVSYRQGAQAYHNARRSPIANLDALPHPYTVSDEFNISTRFNILSELLPEGDWIPGAGFLTSRGCPEGCSFCLDPAINGRRARFHSPAYVREVLEFCADRFSGGAGAFFFGDAAFTLNKKRLARMLETLKGLPYTYQIQTRADYLDTPTIERLAANGFTNVAIGAETFNEDILRTVVRKRLEVRDVLKAARAVSRAGMKPILTFIIGLPGETRESVMRTLEILRENGLYDATFFPLVVFKGTALFDEFKARVTPEEMENLRLNPSSEEFISVSDEFPRAQELMDFTEQVNTELLSSRPTALP
ncbi:MAG: hypothetical protein CVT63_00890 [Candidatus Anoxymicrobium japonicum]|uniref:Uncharacterized protein n=1 Tax=Candidatus Anoxymicrobium japonicum TaxID=2013648 RepID=A0A2N3G814_9ACTN|nr:MAG: hypothetical protein CVT63_00890 [Candidatus Anoxymicrobium japonicum]